MVDAVRNSTRAKKPLIVAFDEEEETLKAVEDGLIFATIVQKPFEFGYQSMKALKDVNDGKTIPTTIDTGISTIKKRQPRDVLGRAARDEEVADRDRDPRCPACARSRKN